jgi:hypothetical protein
MREGQWVQIFTRATSGPLEVEYSRDFQVRAADELDLLPEGSAIAEMLADYSVMRINRACECGDSNR